VTFRRRSVAVEPGAVVSEDQLDRIALASHGEPDVRGVRMLERVHHAFAGDVVHEKGDRRRQLDLGDVGVEVDVGIPGDLEDEALKRIRQACPPERRSVKVSNQGADAIRCPRLRVLDFLERALCFTDLPRREMPPRDVNLKGELEEELSEVVV
jgi:hypothetical protein